MRNFLKIIILASSFSTLANQCQVLEDIANQFRLSFKAELKESTYPASAMGQEEFRANVNEKLTYFKGLKSHVDLCYRDYQIEEEFNCSFSTSLVKARHPGGVVTTYTSALEVDGQCRPRYYFGHRMTRNAKGETLLKSLGAMIELNTLNKCVGDYSDDYSFRKYILSQNSFFVMDQYLNYQSPVKVLAKNYISSDELEVRYMASKIEFTFGPASLAISTRDGSVLSSNFLSRDEVSEGRCRTKYNEESGIIYPSTNIDEETFGFKLEYVSN